MLDTYSTSKLPPEGFASVEVNSPTPNQHLAQEGETMIITRVLAYLLIEQEGLMPAADHPLVLRLSASETPKPRYSNSLTLNPNH